MHELSLVMEVVKTVEHFAAENDVKKIETLVLQVGELSSVVPQYIEEIYPLVIEGTILQGTELNIEILPGNVLCKNCSKVYNFMKNMERCPFCGSGERELISGREFFIKEIVAC